MDIHHISHSQIEKYLMCPYQYSLKYFENKVERPSSNLVLGSAYHSALEFNFTQKIKSGFDMPLDTVLDCYADKLDEGILEGTNLFPDWQPELYLKDQGIGLVMCYMNTVSPSVIPIEVEKWLEVPIGDTLIQCRIDLIDENFIVIDHKTAAKAYDQEKADNMIQFSAEAFALRGPIDCEVHVALKYKTPKINIVRTSRTVDDILWWRKLAGQIIKGVRAEVFPYNPNGWWCSSSYCGFYDNCKKGTTSYR